MVNIRRMIGYLMVLFLVICCKGEQRKQAGGTHGHVKVFRMVADTFVCRDSLNDSPTERQMRALGFVDIQEVDASIQVCLIYATADNFVGKVLYRDLRKAFMLPETAWRLVKAQQKLKYNVKCGPRCEGQINGCMSVILQMVVGYTTMVLQLI